MWLRRCSEWWQCLERTQGWFWGCGVGSQLAHGLGLVLCFLQQCMLMWFLSWLVNSSTWWAYLPFNSASWHSATEPWQSSLTQFHLAWNILSEVAMLSSNSLLKAFPQWMTSLLMDQALRGSSGTLAMRESLMLLVLSAMLRWNSAGSHFRMGAIPAVKRIMLLDVFSWGLLVSWNLFSQLRHSTAGLPQRKSSGRRHWWWRTLSDLS